MKLAELGEFGLIELLRRQVGTAPQSESGKRVLLGIGDDVAAWRADDLTLLATTDSLVEGVHFARQTSPATDLGWKALAVNLSDMAAVAGEPEYALITLGLPPETELSWVTKLYDGLLEAAGEFGVAIVGGDIVAASQLFISVALVGRAATANLLTRAAARAGDQVAVTGYLGSAAGGLRLLQGRAAANEEAASYLRQAHLRPQPRLAEGQLLAKAGVGAAIDVSDGLLADLAKLCRASGVAAWVGEERLPLHPSLVTIFGAEAKELALSGGEDYEILVTAPAKIIDEAKSRLEVPLTVLGQVLAEEPGQVTLRDSDGKERPWQGGGWDHLAQMRPSGSS